MPVELLKAQPDSPELHLLWGEAYASQFQDADAEREFRRAIELSPKLPWAHFDLGLLEIHQHRLDVARQEFAAELRLHPENARARYHLAFVLLEQNKPDEAVPLLKEVDAPLLSIRLR
jgi:tetratricopeptide (TPR) repeat protein